jgi:hypothetical protein
MRIIPGANTIYRDAALLREQESVQMFEQGRLAGPVRAGHNHQLAGRHRKGHILQPDGAIRISEPHLFQ